MMSVRHRGAEIRQFILEHVQEHPHDIGALTAQTFGISRQGVHRHLHSLQQQQLLCVSGTTRKRYTLRPLVHWMHTYILSANEAEDLIWRRDIRPLLGALPENVLDIWQYGFTEIFNNAIEHSAGQTVVLSVDQTAIDTKIAILDDGEGIFKKLTREFGLEDERHAVLELAKGKVTTDPAHHTGEGIFFTSRMFDSFRIWAGNVFFTHTPAEAADEEPLDWVHEEHRSSEGTTVFMELHNHASRTSKEVFDRFTSGGDYGFTKTIVPVHLARYGDEKLVSRSQAKRLLAGIDRFKVVFLDFEGVDTIGQAFADEVFRVFIDEHPQIEVFAANVKTPVQHMIGHTAGPRADAIFGDEEP